MVELSVVARAHSGVAARGASRRWRAMLRSNRFTVGGGLLFAIVLPELFHPALRGAGAWANYEPGRIEPTLVASTLALIASHISLRRVGMMPLVEDKALILPSFLACFGLALGLLVAGHEPLGRYHFTLGLIFGVAWYFLVALARGRAGSPRLACIGALPPTEELLATNIDWQFLLEAEMPGDVYGLVVQDGANLDEAWTRVLTRAVVRGIPVYELSHLRERVLGRVRISERPDRVFGSLLPSLPYLRIKRLVDTLAVIPALALALPVMAIVCVLIRLESPGPMIFPQARLGYRGRPFTCYKLRSMRSDVSGPAFTQEGDPRVTRVGRVIRKWRIDELPQLVNILRGEMSWIGPRPEAVSLARLYARSIPNYAYRHAVRPGISGWAAVHQGNVALGDEASLKLEYDFYYIKHFSVWLDILIVLMTIRTVLTGFGSR